MIGIKQVKTWPEKWQKKLLETYKIDKRDSAIIRAEIAKEMRALSLVDEKGFYIGSEKSPGIKAEQKSPGTKKPGAATKTKSTTETTTRKTKDKIRAGGKRKNGTDGRLATLITEESETEIITEDITFDELVNRIRAAMDDYNNKLGYDWETWQTKGKPQQWRGMCSAVGKIFKKNRGILKQQPKMQSSGIISNNGAYDYNGKLSTLFDFYRDLCRFVGLPCKYYDFGDFAGIEFQTLLNWSAPTSAAFDFYKKAMAEQAESIAACAEGSRIVSVVGLARLNAFHGWTKTSEVIHNTGSAVTPTAALPHFDAPMLESPENSGETS